MTSSPRSTGRRMALGAGVLAVVLTVVWVALDLDEGISEPLPAAGPSRLPSDRPTPAHTLPAEPLPEAIDSASTPDALLATVQDVDETAQGQPAPSSSDTSIRLELSLRGRILDGGGAPLADASLVLFPDATTLIKRGLSRDWSSLVRGGGVESLAATRTEPDGRFRLDDHLRSTDAGLFLANKAKVSLWVRAAGRASALFEVPRAALPSGDVGDLLMDIPGSRLRLTVSGPGGHAVEGAAVAVQSWVPHESVEQHFGVLTGSALLQDRVTDASGHADLDSLWPGTYHLEISRLGFVPCVQKGITLGAGETQALDVRLETGGVVAGVVRDLEGGPIEGARVLATSSKRRSHGEGALHETADQVAQSVDRRLTAQPEAARPLTDAEGRFRREGLDVNRVDLAVSAPGYEAVRLDDIPVGSTSILALMQPAATANVTVVSAATGELLPTAELLAFRHTHAEPGNYSWGSGPPRFEIEAHPVDGNAGTFRVVGLSAARTELEVTAAGFAPASVDIPGVSPGAHEDVVVRMEPPSALTGRFVDPDGVPLPGVNISIKNDSDPMAMLNPGEKTKSDEGGAFRFEPIAGATWTVNAHSRGYLSLEPRTVDVPVGRGVDLGTLVLSPTGRLFGTVRHPDGRPAAKVSVFAQVLVEKHIRNGSYWPATSDDDGSYAIDNLPPGDVRVHAQPGADVTVPLALSEELQVDLTLRAWPVFRGRVLSGGVPVPGALVRSIVVSGTGEDKDKNRRAGPSATADAGGTYVLILEQVLGVSQVELRAHAPDGSGGRSEARVVQPDFDQRLSLDLTLGAGALGGRVERPGGGPIEASLLQGISLELSHEGWPEQPKRFGPGRDVDDAAHPAPDGSFRFPHLEPGSYRIQAKGEGVATTWHGPFTVSAEVHSDDLRLELPLDARLSGEVHDEYGEAVRRSVFIHRLDDPQSVMSVFAPDGRFDVSGLQAGTWRLVVSDNRYRDALLDPAHASEAGQEPAPIHASMDVVLADGEHRTVTLQLVP